MHEHEIIRCADCDVLIRSCRCAGVKPKVVKDRQCISCAYEEEYERRGREHAVREALLDDEG